MNAAELRINTDGGFRERFGAWVFVVQRKEEGHAGPLHVVAGKADDTMPASHQPMEVTAALMAVQWLKCHRSTVTGTIDSDSNYVVKSANVDYLKWEARNWRRADGKPVMYQELWRPLLEDLSALHPRPRFVLIPRRSNKKADALCTLVLKACHPGCITKTWDQVANAVRRAFEDCPKAVSEGLIEQVGREVTETSEPRVWNFYCAPNGGTT